MKFLVSFKTPNAVHDAVLDFAEREVERQIQHGIGSGEERRQERVEELTERALKFTDRWVRYGELLTVEFDLNSGTATVVRRCQ